MKQVSQVSDANFNIPDEVKEDLVEILLSYSDEWLGMGHYSNQLIKDLIDTFVGTCSTWLVLGDYCYSGEFIFASEISPKEVLVISSQFGSCSFCDSFASLLERARSKRIDTNREKFRSFLKENIGQIFTVFTIRFSKEPGTDDILQALKDRKANGLLNTTLL